MEYEIELLPQHEESHLELRFREGGKVQVILVPLTTGIPMLLKCVSILCNSRHGDAVRGFPEFAALEKAIRRIQ